MAAIKQKMFHVSWPSGFLLIIITKNNKEQYLKTTVIKRGEETQIQAGKQRGRFKGSICL